MAHLVLSLAEWRTARAHNRRLWSLPLQARTVREPEHSPGYILALEIFRVMNIFMMAMVFTGCMLLALNA